MQLALPRPVVEVSRCHMCSAALQNTRIVTRDQDGIPRRFCTKDCYLLWARHNTSQFVARRVS